MSAFKDWLNGLASKTTPVDADELYLRDSSGTPSSKKLTWANAKTTLKTYFDTLYQSVLVSGTNIKTINSTSLLGSGDLTVSAAPGGSTTQVQYNNAGAFAGSPIWVANANLVNFQSGMTSQRARFHLFYVDESNYSSVEVDSGVGTSYAGIGPREAGSMINKILGFDIGWLSSVNLARFSRTDVIFYGLHLKTGTADTYDIGTSSARFRTGYFKNLSLSGNLATGIVAKSADYTATTNDHTITVDASGGAVTITGFACASNAGKRLTIKKTDSSGNAVTFDPNASETVDGASSKATSTQYGGFTVQVNEAATAWFVVATF